MVGKIGKPPAIKHSSFIEGVEIGFLPDPAHTEKNAKSFFMRYDGVKLPESCVEKYDLSYNIAHFKWIKRLIEFNETLEVKKVPVPKNLNRKMCLNYSKYAQMDCKPTLAIFHFATADAIDYMVEHEGWDKEAKSTAVYVRLWARFIQIVSAYTPEDGFDVEKPVDRQEKIDFLFFFGDFYGNCTYLGGQNHISLWGNQKHVHIICTTVVWVQNILLKDRNVGFFLPGYLQCNSVENLHTDIRRINPFPTSIIYSRILRGICMTQLLGESVKGSSYELDQGKDWLISLSDHKKLQEPKPEEAADMGLFDAAEIMLKERTFTEDVVISFIGGGILSKILIGKDPERPKATCVKCCIEFWTDTSETSNHLLNALIECKEYAPDALVRPSDVGHLIFQRIDDLFESNCEKDIGKTGLVDAFETFVSETISEEFENIPPCNFNAIIKKAITWKWYHYTKFLNSDFLEVNRYEIEQEANASKSTKSRALLDPYIGPQDWRDPANWQQWMDPIERVEDDFYRYDRSGMDDGTDDLDLDFGMVDDHGNDDRGNENVSEMANGQDSELIDSPNNLDLDLDLDFEMAEGQGNDSVNANVDSFNENISETVNSPNHPDLNFDMADGHGNGDTVNENVTKLAEGQGNGGKVNKKFKFKKFVGSQQKVDSEMVKSPNRLDLDSAMAEGHGNIDISNNAEMVDSQENVELVGSNFATTSGHSSVNEVRDKVSERAPEVVETSPPVYAPENVLSFEQFLDDLSD